MFLVDCLPEQEALMNQDVPAVRVSFCRQYQRRGLSPSSTSESVSRHAGKPCVVAGPDFAAQRAARLDKRGVGSQTGRIQAIFSDRKAHHPWLNRMPTTS